MDDDIFRILVSTDNHLGFQDKSPVRYADSFAAFEEVLRTANSEECDFVLLAGDLFHENKPSRRTVYNTLNLLRKHCTGSHPVYMEIMNKQEEIFKYSPLKRVNYEDPCHSICMPVFAIHGNHDDPSRDGVGDPLAALDFFSSSNLINYVGKHEQVEDIEITPIIIRKGKTTIAIYPLGAIRDERLNRMWTNKKVKFLKPSGDLGLGTVINVFVLHQNRDYGRGRKNCVHETMIPEWMDVVIWGNEHECVPSMVESLAGTFRIYQPGSSVATSLSEGESSRYPKHMGILEICLDKFRLRPVPYHQVRPFLYSDLALSSVEGLDARSSRLEDTVLEVLTARVKQMVREARTLITDEMRNTGPKSVDASFIIKDPQKVIVRLRVDYTGFPMNCLNLQRFGTKFVNEVANPSDIILFARKKAEGVKSVNPSGHSTAFQSEFNAWLEGDKEAVNKIKVEDLVCDALTNQQKQLGILAPESLSLALEEFVIRKVPSAINDVVEETLESTQKLLRKDPTAVNKDDIQAAALKAKEMQGISVGRGTTNATKREGRTEIGEDTLNGTTGKPATKKVVATNVTSIRNKEVELEDKSDAEDDDDKPVTRKRGRQPNKIDSKVPAKKGKSSATKNTSNAAPSARTSRASTRAKKPVVYEDPDDDIISLESGEESDAFEDLQQHDEDDDLFDTYEDETPKRKRAAQGSKKKPSSSNRGASKSRGKKSVTTNKNKAKSSKEIITIPDDISDGSSDEQPTPKSNVNAISKHQSSTAKQQKLAFSTNNAPSTTSSNRSSKKRNTSSAIDDW